MTIKGQGVEMLRRSDLQRQTNAEHAIRVAIDVVEAMPADVRLTDAVVLLGAAKDSVADYIDGIEKRRRVLDESAVIESARKAIRKVSHD